jgi:hypothetical protein
VDGTAQGVAFRLPPCQPFLPALFPSVYGFLEKKTGSRHRVSGRGRKQHLVHYLFRMDKNFLVKGKRLQKVKNFGHHPVGIKPN